MWSVLVVLTFGQAERLGYFKVWPVWVVMAFGQARRLGCGECFWVVCVGCIGSQTRGTAGVWGIGWSCLCWLSWLWDKQEGWGVGKLWLALCWLSCFGESGKAGVHPMHTCEDYFFLFV
jgi:hypothetical protein